jgi:hypothetical protein
MKKLIYVAGKYTGKTWSEIEDNIRKAEEVSIQLIQRGWAVITPHKNTGHYEIYEKVAGITYNDWIEISKTLLSKCDAIIMLHGWQSSKGARIEYDFACEMGMPIYTEVPDLELGNPDLFIHKPGKNIGSYKG